MASDQEKLDRAKARLAVRQKAARAARAAVAQTKRTVARLLARVVQGQKRRPGAWMPNVVKDPARSIGRFRVAASPRGVLHTTEGSTMAGADAALKAAGAEPHFLIGPLGQVKQYRPVTEAATALEHPSGTPETNHMHAVQIEVVGFAAHPGEWPVAQQKAVARVMAWLVGHGIPLRCTVPFTDSRHVRRFSDAQWRTYNGWCGHQHVPDQSSGHWDPGAIKIDPLFARAKVLL